MSDRKQGQYGPTFRERIANDKVFLLSMIDDPIKTFNAYRYEIDPTALENLTRLSEDIRSRAIEVFNNSEIDIAAGRPCSM